MTHVEDRVENSIIYLCWPAIECDAMLTNNKNFFFNVSLRRENRLNFSNLLPYIALIASAQFCNV